MLKKCNENKSVLKTLQFSFERVVVGTRLGAAITAIAYFRLRKFAKHIVDTRVNS